MDPMSFKDGLKPRRDLLNNSQNSPFFSKLPGELRNVIYTMIFVQNIFGKDVRHGLLSPSALRTCYQFYTEGVTFLYACNEHKIALDPDMAIYHAVPRIHSQIISTRNISMIRRLELELRLPEKEQSGEICMSHLTSTEEHLRGICLSLSSSGAVLESLTVDVLNGWMLYPEATFWFLDVLKELRVAGKVRVLGTEECPWNGTHELVQDIKNEMVAPDIMDSEGRSQVMIRRMCQDLWDYLNVCIEHVEDWPEESADSHEKAAALEELMHVFEVEGGLRGEMHFPVGSKPMEVIQGAIWSIEAIYAKIDLKRFDEYHKGATKARERLYMRKAFREMVAHEVPDIYAFE
ncbi:hypothetical protein MMC07_000446 [Pseudocyphellaria aurata]|nr:hypothetical protein [Pseudocyphellaria aurata]